MDKKYTLKDIQLEIEEYTNPREIKDHDQRYFKARLWPIFFGWEYIVDDSLDIEAELTALIQLAIEGKQTEWGETPETVIGRKLVECALKRVTPEFDDIIDEIQEKQFEEDA